MSSRPQRDSKGFLDRDLARHALTSADARSNKFVDAVCKSRSEQEGDPRRANRRSDPQAQTQRRPTRVDNPNIRRRRRIRIHCCRVWRPRTFQRDLKEQRRDVFVCNSELLSQGATDFFKMMVAVTQRQSCNEKAKAQEHTPKIKTTKVVCGCFFLNGSKTNGCGQTTV